MSESYLDRLLDELVPTESRDGWDDVLHRARRSQRRFVLLVAAVAVLVLAPATWAALKAFEGTPAPPPVRRAWNQTNREWAKNILAKDLPLAEVQKAHGVLQVQTKDGPYDLWVAPSTTGGVCYLGALERDRHAGLQLGVTEECLRGDREPLLASNITATNGFWEDGSATRGVLIGYARGSEKTVRVHWKDGRTMTLPVVEHFFLAPLAGRDLWGFQSVTARDANGRIITGGPF